MLKFFCLLLLLILEVHCRHHHGFGKKTITKLRNGKKESIEHVPYFVQINYSNSSEYSVTFCGGSILSQNWILTAAHCIHTDKILHYRIIPGSDVLYNVNSSLKYYKVKDYVKHENFRGGKYLILDGELSNDIGLIKLSEPLIFSETIKPIKIRPTTVEKELLKVSGFGIINENEDRAYKLESIVIPKDSKLCKDSIMPDDLFCAGTKHEYACRGDSGGPAVDLNGELVGISSAADSGECSDKMSRSYYTSVTYHLKWIQDHINVTTISNSEDKNDKFFNDDLLNLV